MADLDGEALDFYSRRNFASLLNHVPPQERQQIADAHDYDHRARKVHFEPHLRAWILLQLTKDETLRDMQSAVNDDPLYQLLGAGMDVSLGGPSEAHQNRPYEALMSILLRVLADVERIPKSKRVLQELTPGVLRDIGDVLSHTVLFDSTTSHLPKRIKAWAEEQSGAELPLKVHVRLHSGCGGIDRVLLRREHEHDHQQYETLLDLNHPPDEHAIYLHDRGYRELSVYDQVVDAGHDFVTRFHRQTTVDPVRDLPLPDDKQLDNGYSLIQDRIVTLGSEKIRPPIRIA